MEQFPNNNPENTNQESADTGVLADMPSYEEMRRQNAVPEGVRDEQDYQEYLAERSAREAESVATEQKEAAEKHERINTFEKRIALNKDFYNRAAFAQACSLASDPEEYERRNGSSQFARFLTDILYRGVADDNINNSNIRSLWIGNKDNIVEKDFIIKQDDEDGFNRFYQKSLISSFGKEENMNSENETVNRAKEMMDTKKYENDFSEFLDKSSEKITRHNIEYIEEEMAMLNHRSGGMFNYTHDLDGEYQGITLKKEDAIIPTLESRLKLEEQILEVKKKIVEIIAQVKEREYQEDTTRSTQGRRVIARISSRH